MNRRERERSTWVRETQMFQQIAGTPVTPAEDLEAEFDRFGMHRRVRELKSIAEQRAIQDVARRVR